MPNLGAPEIVIIAVVAILLFGAAKLPVFAKSLGESMRIFKKEIKGNDEKKPTELPPVIAEQGSAPAQPTTVETHTDTR